MTEVVDTDRIGGITDAGWLEWFGQIADCFDPWRDWLSKQCFPREGPLHDWLEQDIQDAIKAADALRLVTKPRTKRFAARWSTLRKHHEELDGRGK
jgi:hypothetical protein